MFSFQEWKAVESIMEDVVICASWRHLVPHVHALMESQWSRIRRHAVTVSSEEYIHDRLVKIWCHNTRPIDNNIKLKSIRQFCNHAQLLKERNSGGPQHSQLDVLYERLAATFKLPNFGFCTHTTALCPMEQSSMLSAKFDCPLSSGPPELFTAAHDCETELCLLYITQTLSLTNDCKLHPPIGKTDWL